MRRLLIADVHANLPAFEAVLRDAGEVDEVVFLGDIVGYGPHPAQCLDLLLRIGARSIVGNHDREVLALTACPEPPARPVNWLQWTFRQLAQAHLAYLASLPEERVINCGGEQVRVMHHPPGAPYLHPAMPDAVLSRHFRAVPGSAVFFGHSHRQIDRTVDGRRLVCIPAVGQPRDGDPRAGYALESDGELSFHRVCHDVERVVADVRAIGLDPAFTRRWVRFVRAGFDHEWSREYVQ